MVDSIYIEKCLKVLKGGSPIKDGLVHEAPTSGIWGGKCMKGFGFDAVTNSTHYAVTTVRSRSEDIFQAQYFRI